MRTSLPVVPSKSSAGSAPAENPPGPAKLPEVDENGDAIFRFAIPERNRELSLAEFYRQGLYDLLTTVRLYSNGNPVIVDGFAMLNAPEAVISLRSASESQAPEESSK